MELKRLPPEGWGKKLQRAREDAGLSLQAAETRIRPLLPTSYRTLARLETLDDCPQDARRQLQAFVAILAYGFDPADFGLAGCSAAEFIDRAVALRKLHIDVSPSIPWYYGTPGAEAA
jgi:hypothetical protein